MADVSTMAMLVACPLPTRRPDTLYSFQEKGKLSGLSILRYAPFSRESMRYESWGVVFFSVMPAAFILFQCLHSIRIIRS